MALLYANTNLRATVEGHGFSRAAKSLNGQGL